MKNKKDTKKTNIKKYAGGGMYKGRSNSKKLDLAETYLRNKGISPGDMVKLNKRLKGS